MRSLWTSLIFSLLLLQSCQPTIQEQLMLPDPAWRCKYKHIRRAGYTHLKRLYEQPQHPATTPPTTHDSGGSVPGTPSPALTRPATCLVPPLMPFEQSTPPPALRALLLCSLPPISGLLPPALPPPCCVSRTHELSEGAPPSPGAGWQASPLLLGPLQMLLQNSHINVQQLSQ